MLKDWTGSGDEEGLMGWEDLTTAVSKVTGFIEQENTLHLSEKGGRNRGVSKRKKKEKIDLYADKKK